METKTLSRRALFQHGLTAASTLGFPYILSAAVRGGPGRNAPSERVTLGFIGLGDKGFYWNNAALVKSFITFDDCRILGLCDVNRPRFEEAKAFVDKRYGNRDSRGYQDFREMLLADDIDAVVIATPHHWHAIPTIMACEHRKDVYVEKPMAQTVRRARAMVEAARRYGCVVQVGTQARSSRKFDYACRIIREGQIGRIKQIRIGCGRPPGRCNLPAEPVPEGLNWNLWVGPSQWRPYHVELYEHGGHYINFGGGGVTDWGQHFFDVAQWALDMDRNGPVEVHPPDGRERMFVTFKYANGIEMILHMDKEGKRLSQGTDFIGTEGRIQTMAWDDYVHFKPASLGLKYHVQARGGMSQGLCNAHIRNFLDCVRSRQRPNADVEIGCRSVTVAHLANIVLWTKRSLRWDPTKEQFINDERANRYLDITCREPWHI